VRIHVGNIPSLIFHSMVIGYGRFGGSKTTAAELSTIFQSMEENDLLHPKRLLTGLRLQSGIELAEVLILVIQATFLGPKL
jgi:hypothetical protein